MNENPASDTAAKVHALEQRLLAEQNLPAAIGAGVVAALVGAAIWAAVTVFTNYQIGWMAVGVGFLVGWAVRMVGKGVTKPFGVIGAVLALLGCALGNVLTIYGVVANTTNTSFFTVIGMVPLSAVVNAFGEAMQPMDFLFYGIAVIEGYKFSFRRVTEQELAAVS